MYRFLILLLIVLLGVGCGGNNVDPKKAIEESKGKIDIDALVDEINSSRKITDQQAEILSKVEVLELNGLTSITDKQAESLSKVKRWLGLNGLTSITGEQAEILATVEMLSISEACQKLIDKYK